MLWEIFLITFQSNNRYTSDGKHLWKKTSKRKRNLEKISISPCRGNFKNIKYATAPAYPLKNAVAAKAVVQASWDSEKKSAITALFVFSYNTISF